MMMKDELNVLLHSDLKAHTGLLLLGISFLVEVGVIHIQADSFKEANMPIKWDKPYRHSVHSFLDFKECLHEDTHQNMHFSRTYSVYLN